MQHIKTKCENTNSEWQLHFSQKSEEVSPKTQEQPSTYKKHIWSLLPGYASRTLADLINPSISAKKRKTTFICVPLNTPIWSSRANKKVKMTHLITFSTGITLMGWSKRTEITKGTGLWCNLDQNALLKTYVSGLIELVRYRSHLPWPRLLLPMCYKHFNDSMWYLIII